MSETARKPARKKPADRPTQEEIINAEVARRVEMIIDGEQLDRMMVNRLTNVVSSLCGCRCGDHPLPPHVDAIMNDALMAALGRLERIANNDRPLLLPCRKCGE